MYGKASNGSDAPCKQRPKSKGVGIRRKRTVQARHLQPGAFVQPTEDPHMRIAPLAVALFLTASCSRTVKVETDPATGRTDVDVQAPNVPETYSGTVSAVGASGVSGTASGTTANDSTHVTVNVSGAQAGATLPWHIHEGTCTDASPPIAGPASSYPPLVVGADGRATAQAHVPVGLNEAKNYIINVHASPTNLGTIVACGDFND